MARNERIEIIKEIEKLRDSKVFTYLTSDRPNASSQMQKDILPIFVNQLGNNQYKNIDLFIFTHGGDIITAFGLSRLFREYSNNIGTLIPDCCHSAGTLFALGSKEIIMTKGATLSPIDPSISRPLNPAVQLNPQTPPQIIPLSVESVAGYLSLVTKEWHADKNALLSILAQKVHPLSLGDVYRTRQQIEMLATELLKQHRNDNKKIKKIVNTLSKKLGSHDYLIYPTEAYNLLGSQINKTSKVENLIWDLYTDYIKEMELGIPYDPSILLAQQPSMPRFSNATQILAIIESTNKIDKAIRKVKISEMQVQTQMGIMNQIIEETVYAGWQ